MEHFCTLFDFRYMPQGMALHGSLLRHAGDFELWVLCMDRLVEEALRRMKLPRVRPLALQEVETGALLRVKPARSSAEYCWTLTPFLPGFVMDQDPSVRRATYIDADCFFFSSPGRILDELDQTDKDVLITLHDFVPQYTIRSWVHGFYCVQFIPFRNTPGGRKVMQWWQERCLDWCSIRPEPGKRYADQKYLDDWATRFANEVHVLRDCSLTLAPWNVGKYRVSSIAPCMYHFQGYRVLSLRKCLANYGYRFPKEVFGRFYAKYNREVRRALVSLRKIGLEPRFSTLPPGTGPRWERFKFTLTGCVRYMPLS